MILVVLIEILLAKRRSIDSLDLSTSGFLLSYEFSSDKSLLVVILVAYTGNWSMSLTASDLRS